MPYRRGPKGPKDRKPRKKAKNLPRPNKRSQGYKIPVYDLSQKEEP